LIDNSQRLSDNILELTKLELTFSGNFTANTHPSHQTWAIFSTAHRTARRMVTPVVTWKGYFLRTDRFHQLPEAKLFLRELSVRRPGTCHSKVLTQFKN
jgi:hypothetical protein